MKKQITILSLLAGTSALLAGCSLYRDIARTNVVYYAYEGQERPPAEVATLYCGPRGTGFSVFEVDHEKLDTFRKMPADADEIGTTHIDVESGLHDFTATYYKVTTGDRYESTAYSFEPMHFSATLQPGKVYEIVNDYDNASEGRLIPKVIIRSKNPRKLIRAEKEEINAAKKRLEDSSAD